MTDLTIPTPTADPGTTMPHPLTPMRLAWHARALWHRITRPITMGVRGILLEEPPDAPPRVLLIRHSYVRGWHFPGGGVGRGETLVAAMRREVREEVGLSVESGVQPLGVYARFRHGASDHVAVFVATAWTGTPTVDRMEIVEARFFPVDALPEETTPATRRRLAEYLGHAPRAEHW